MSAKEIHESIQTAERKMENVLRTQNRFSNEYMRAVRDYQKLLHLMDSTEHKNEE